MNELYRKQSTMNHIAHFVHFYELYLNACLNKKVEIISILTRPERLNAELPIRHALHIIWNSEISLCCSAHVI
jgi:hypothetical protein